MNVIIKINGREAIPVRAIPLLTNWETMSPDVVAQALAWDDHQYRFHGLNAFRREGSEVKHIAATWWENFPCEELDALHAELKRKEDAGLISEKQGYRDWMQGALPILPAGAFVWRDEFEPLHIRRHSPRALCKMSDTASNGVMPEAEQARRVALDFDPYIPEPEKRRIVMEGFEDLLTDTAPAQTATPAPVVNALECASDDPAPETKEQRQDRRLKACIDAGLPMNGKAASLRLPYGVGAIAEREGVTRQAFSTDVKAALERRGNAKREGVTVHRA